MKRILTIFAIFVFLICLLPVKALANADESFTLMLYVDGSTLEERGGYFSQDLDELLAALPNDSRFNVVICTGGSIRWVNPAIQPNCVQYHAITSSGMQSSGVITRQSNLGGDTLSAFLRYATSNFPASRYGLIFWGHGGSSPIGFGRSAQDDVGMSLAMINKGLSDGLGGKRLAFVGFDACLMASVDAALATMEHAEYFVASEELSPSFGWSYAPIMHALAENPALPGADICKLIADSYIEGIRSKMDPFMPALTISVVECDKLGALNGALSALSKKLDSTLGEIKGFAAVSKARSDTKYFGTVGDSRDMIDLYDFADKLPPSKEAAKLKSSIKSAVVYNRALNSAASGGLSAYFPMQNGSVFARASQYLNYAPAREFTAFAARFYGIYSAGRAAINASRDGAKLVIDEGSLPYVRSVEAVAVMTLPHGRRAALAFSPLELNGGVAKLGGAIPGLSAGGAAVFFEREKGGGSRVSVPVMWNGKYARVEIVNNGGAFMFDAAAYKAGAEIFGIGPGDTFEFLYPVLDDPSGLSYHKGAAHGFDSLSRLSAKELSEYETAFRVTDVYGARHLFW